MESLVPSHVPEQCPKMKGNMWMDVQYFIRQQGDATFYRTISTVQSILKYTVFNLSNNITILSILLDLH